MSKTPISILQETVAKIGGPLPVYTEICMTGIQNQKFIIEVTWDKYKTKGDGFSKKEAKQNAAKKMIQLLFSRTSLQFESSVLSPANIVNPNEVIIESKSSLPSPINFMKSIDVSDSSEDSFTNYVGLLQEHCQKMRFPDPCYTYVSTNGPSHQPDFIISCTIKSEQKEGSGSTKKIAKQNAAKKLLEHLIENKLSSVNSMDKLEIKYKELQISYPALDTTQQNTNILNTYSKIKEMPLMINETLHVQYYHIAVAKLYSDILNFQKNKIMLLHEMKEYCLDNVLEVIQEITKTTASMIHFKSKCDNHNIVGFRLATSPVLIQIGISSRKEEAEKKAVVNMLEYLVYFM